MTFETNLEQFDAFREFFKPNPMILWHISNHAMFILMFLINVYLLPRITIVAETIYAINMIRYIYQWNDWVSLEDDGKMLNTCMFLASVVLQGAIIAYYMNTKLRNASHKEGDKLEKLVDDLNLASAGENSDEKEDKACEEEEPEKAEVEVECDKNSLGHVSLDTIGS